MTCRPAARRFGPAGAARPHAGAELTDRLVDELIIWGDAGTIAARTAWAIATGTGFRCGVVIAGISDLVSCWGTANNAPFYDYLLGGRPGEQPARYLERSPIMRLSPASRPALILHGQQDRCVPPGQAEELYAGVRGFGIEAELVSYPREGHQVREPAHVEDQRERILRWLGTHLGAPR